MDDATFKAIADTYGITAAELSAPPAEAERAREVGRVMNVIRTLDTTQLRLIAETAEALAGKTQRPERN